MYACTAVLLYAAGATIRAMAAQVSFDVTSGVDLQRDLARRILLRECLAAEDATARTGDPGGPRHLP